MFESEVRTYENCIMTADVATFKSCITRNGVRLCD